MTTKSNLRDARAVADRLEAAGNPFDANIIRKLCRSNASLWETASRLSFDNHALQRAAEKPHGQD